MSKPTITLSLQPSTKGKSVAEKEEFTCPCENCGSLKGRIVWCSDLCLCDPCKLELLEGDSVES